MRKRALYRDHLPDMNHCRCAFRPFARAPAHAVFSNAHFIFGFEDKTFLLLFRQQGGNSTFLLMCSCTRYDVARLCCFDMTAFVDMREVAASAFKRDGSLARSRVLPAAMP